MKILAAIAALLLFGGGVIAWRQGSSLCLFRMTSAGPSVPIRAIIQTGPVKEALQTSYLAELLELSLDPPCFTSQINLQTARQKLRASPVIVDAEVKIQEEGILYIDYTTRKPVALLYDYENIALDRSGCPFPLAPFYSPKKLPYVYLGLTDPLRWNTPLPEKKMELVFSLLDILSGPMICDLFEVERIDVSKAFERSLGSEEIVLLIQDRLTRSSGTKEISYLFPRILRLSTKNYPQELANYLKLREHLLEKEQTRLRLPCEGEKSVCHPHTVIDFRISQLALIDTPQSTR